jgi:hypothetical protein
MQGSYLIRITKPHVSPRGVCNSIHHQQSRYGDSRLKIGPLAIFQKWAGPTALPSPNVLDYAEMRGLSLRGELLVGQYN